MLVEVTQRQPGDLSVDIAPQLVDGALYDARHQVALEPTEKRAQQVDGDNDQQDLVHRREIHALAGPQIHLGQHLRLVGLTRRLKLRDHLLLGPIVARVPVDLPAHGALEDVVGGLRHDLRSPDLTTDADYGQQNDDDDERALGVQSVHQALERPFKVLGLLTGPDQPLRPGTMLLHVRPTARATCAVATLCLLKVLTPAHAASSAESCEYTISW